MGAATKDYVLGRGKFFFDPFLPNTKTKTGERYLGNTTEFNINVESETLDHFNSDEGVRTKDDSTILELNRSGNVITDNMAAENVALFLLGDVSTVNQLSTPVVAESLGVAMEDRYYQLGSSTANPQGVRNVNSVTLNFDPSGTPVAMVLDTDYTLDADLGRVYFIEGGMADGVLDVEVNYTPTANNRERVTTNASVSVEGAVRFIAYNAKGSQKDVYIPFATLTPSGDWALKGDDWQNLSFGVEIGELTGQAAMYIDGRAA